jgi:hypothetical protein
MMMMMKMMMMKKTMMMKMMKMMKINIIKIKRPILKIKINKNNRMIKLK